MNFHLLLKYIIIQFTIKLKEHQFKLLKKANGKEVYSNLRDDREKQSPKFQLGQLVRTAHIKRVFSKGDNTNYSYKLYTITEVIHDTIPH